MFTLNKMTKDDYLRAEGAQMMVRRLCEWFESGDSVFPITDGEKIRMVKCTPQQTLDAVKRFTAGVINADIFLRYDDLVQCPVWGEKNGKRVIERIDIITKQDYDVKLGRK